MSPVYLASPVPDSRESSRVSAYLVSIYTEYSLSRL